MSYKFIDDRQVLNRQALVNIGSPAGDSVDDIFARIDALFAGLTSSATYTAKKVALTSVTTSLVVTIPAQPDTSYIVLAMMENDLDAFPQYQQVEVVAKSTTGFTFKWNSPLNSNNYILNYIIPPKTATVAEIPVSGGTTSVVLPLLIPQNGPNYAIISETLNLSDANPQFQTPVITSQTNTNFTESLNVPTAGFGYQISYTASPSGQLAVGASTTSLIVDLPVKYGSNGYAVVAALSNITDVNPLFQPLLVTGKNGNQFTISWPIAVPTSNYILTYYAISVTT